MKEKTQQILVVDDDTRLRNLLAKYLSESGFKVSAAKDTEDAKLLLQEKVFDILILDVMMPKESGVEFTKLVRKTSQVPILMLTAKNNHSDRIDGLEAGADDYMSKPFEPKELLLRINNILKRIKQNYITNQNRISQFGNFTFSFDDSRLKKDDEYLHITDGEAKILTILCNNLGKAIAREKLAQICDNIDVRSIDVQITRLRRKIETNPKKPNFLQTIRNQGYVLYN
jgi:two-component system phosphate regulon response regulator OmpR